MALPEPSRAAPNASPNASRTLLPNTTEPVPEHHRTLPEHTLIYNIPWAGLPWGRTRLRYNREAMAIWAGSCNLQEPLTC